MINEIKENKEKLTQAVSAASEKNYFDFEKSIQDIIKDKVDAHPGVQAYRADIQYYDTFTNGLPTEPQVVADEPENEPENKESDLENKEEL